MTVISIEPTFPHFAETNGLPLESGYIYIGEANLNPETNPVTVYWDLELTIPVSQPIRTIGGRAVRDGTPSRIYIDGNYSMTVKNRVSALVYSASSHADTQINVTLLDFIADLRGITVVEDDIIEIKSHTALGDGGEGSFYGSAVAAPGTYVDNNGTIIIPSGGDGSEAWLRQYNSTVNIAWFNDDLASAAAAVPATGGALQLNEGTYVSPWVDQANRLSRGNIEIVGVGRPNFTAAFDGLTGGSIIRGPLVYTGDNTTLRDFGVDCGSTVCTELFAGVAQEALFHLQTNQVTPDAPSQNVTLDNLSAICKPASAVHANLFENVANSKMDGIETMHGNSGTVIKGENIQVGKVTGRGHANYTLLVKSDSYANSNNIDIEQVSCRALAAVKPSWDTNGVYIQAAGADASNIKIHQITCRDVKDAVTVEGLTTFAVNNPFIGEAYETGSDHTLFTNGIVNDLSVSVIHGRDTNFGIVVSLSSTNAVIDHAYVNTSVNYGLQNSGNGTKFSNILVKNPTAGGIRNVVGDLHLENYTLTGHATRVAILAGTVTGEGFVDNAPVPALTAAADGVLTSPFGVIDSTAAFAAAATATAYPFAGTGANNGLLVIRDDSLGTTAVFVVDLNIGATLIGGSIATATVAHGATDWEITLSASAPRTIKWCFYGT